MILDGQLHVGLKEIIANPITVFQHKPAARPINREDANLVAGRLDKRGDFRRGKLQKTLEGNHRFPPMRGRKRGVRLAYSA